MRASRAIELGLEVRASLGRHDTAALRYARDDSVVAGARYARVCALPVPLRLPLEGRVPFVA